MASVDAERAAAALFHLDAGCSREEWVKAGMAAKSAGLSFDDFHSWSMSGGNYEGEKDCYSVWKSFKEDGPVTERSLFAMANAQGWEDSTRRNHAPPQIRRANARTQRALVSQGKPILGVSVTDVWDRCEQAAALHSYIMRKQGIPDGLRIYPLGATPIVIRNQNTGGCLVVPCCTPDGTLKTLQFISEHGPKLNLPGASFGDGYFVVGDLSQSSRLFIVEGIGQAWAVWRATGDAAVVSFGAGRMAGVARILRNNDMAKRLVVLPDRGKECQAEAIARAINGEWCEMPEDKPTNYDANDFMQEHDAEALARLLNRSKTPLMRFRLVAGADLAKEPPLRWMVRGVLPLEGMAALYGPSGCGKSFMTLDIAATVAGGGTEWFGRRVVQRPVTYCVLEGEAGMGKRVTAWSIRHKKPIPNSLRFITQPFDLLRADDVVDLAASVRAAGGTGGLVILDTLNRAAPGADENSSVDMGNIIAAAKRLQLLTRGLVLLVHHTGKDVAKGLRGHSSLYAALDGAIEVSKTESRREWTVAKSKDDETGRVHAFKLEVVTVGFGDDGEEITSCVAAPNESEKSIRHVKLPQGDNQKIALGALAELLRESPDFEKDGAPPGRPCIRLDAAVCHVAERMVCDNKHKTSRAREAVNGLGARGLLGIKGDWIWRI